MILVVSFHKFSCCSGHSIYGIYLLTLNIRSVFNEYYPINISYYLYSRSIFNVNHERARSRLNCIFLYFKLGTWSIFSNSLTCPPGPLLHEIPSDVRWSAASLVRLRPSERQRGEGRSLQLRPTRVSPRILWRLHSATERQDAPEDRPLPRQHLGHHQERVGSRHMGQAEIH